MLAAFASTANFSCSFPSLSRPYTPPFASARVDSTAFLIWPPPTGGMMYVAGFASSFPIADKPFFESTSPVIKFPVFVAMVATFGRADEIGTRPPPSSPPTNGMSCATFSPSLLLFHRRFWCLPLQMIFPALSSHFPVPP